MFPSFKMGGKHYVCFQQLWLEWGPGIKKVLGGHKWTCISFHILSHRKLEYLSLSYSHFHYSYWTPRPFSYYWYSNNTGVFLQQISGMLLFRQIFKPRSVDLELFSGTSYAWCFYMYMWVANFFKSDFLLSSCSKMSHHPTQKVTGGFSVLRQFWSQINSKDKWWFLFQQRFLSVSFAEKGLVNCIWHQMLYSWKPALLSPLRGTSRSSRKNNNT